MESGEQGQPHVWVVTWSGEDGADVHLFLNEADAQAKYLELCEAWNVHPGLGYLTEDPEALGWGQRDQEPADVEAEDERLGGTGFLMGAAYGESQLNIGGPALVPIR